MNISEMSTIAKPEFHASTPKKRIHPYQSFCTSNESRGYGTMKSSHMIHTRALKPVPSGILSPVYGERINLSLSPEANKISAPPCSIQSSEDESDIFWQNELDHDLDVTPTNVPSFPLVRSTHHLASIDLSVDLDQPLECPICSQCFTTDKAYCRHQEEHLIDLGTPLRTTVSCRHCSKKFKSKLKLKRHHDKHHPAEMKVLMVL